MLDRLITFVDTISFSRPFFRRRSVVLFQVRGAEVPEVPEKGDDG